MQVIAEPNGKQARKSMFHNVLLSIHICVKHGLNGLFAVSSTLVFSVAVGSTQVCLRLVFTGDGVVRALPT